MVSANNQPMWLLIESTWSGEPVADFQTMTPRSVKIGVPWLRLRRYGGRW